MRNLTLLSAVLVIMSLATLPVEAAGKKQMSTKQVACLILPGGIAFALVSAITKKPAFCILNMHKRT